MKQSSCLTRQKVQLGSSMYQSRAQSQDLINRLPEACMTEIFRHLEDPEDRKSCASVCWRWAKILVSLQPDFWHPFSLCQAVHPCLHLSNIVDAKLAAAVVGINTKEVVIDLQLSCSPCSAVSAGAPRLTDAAIQFVTSACRNLQSVRLINCSSITNKAAVIIASNCPALENLKIFQCSITDDGISQVAKQCRKLKWLHIEGSPDVTEASLRALVQDALRLESLTLGGCPQIGEDAIMSILMDHPYLGRFELKGMMVAEPHLNGIRKSSLLQRRVCSFRQLHSLILVKCPGLQDRSMLKFSDIHFRMLRHLVIDECRGVTHVGLMWLVGHTSNPMKLWTIKLAKFCFPKSAELMEVLSFLSGSIQSIILDSCEFGLLMPLHSCEPVAQACPYLKVIKLVHCESIMDFFLSWVSCMSCPRLKEISLIGFSVAAQDQGIFGNFHLILHRNEITKIELGKCCHITDKDICMIARFCLETLQELILDECLLISSGSAMDLRARYCPNLIKLGLSGTLVKDDDIRILMSDGFGHLEELILKGCPGITDGTLHHLAASNLPKLERVNVAGCTNVTREIVDLYQFMWEIEF